MKQDKTINFQDLASIRLELNFLNGDTSVIVLSRVINTVLTTTTIITNSPDETGMHRVADRTYTIEITADEFTRLLERRPQRNNLSII